MANVVSQGPCPSPWHNAGHLSEAYTIYDDGSSHCFTCGYHISANGYKALPRILNSQRNECTPKDNDCPPLPDDTYHVLPKHVREWLSKYEITDAEIEENHICWSGEKNLLVFPVLNAVGNMLMWQGRYFGKAPRHFKYLMRGDKKNTLHILSQGKTDYLVLVEDMISAIKVSRQATVMPLWGSFLSQDTAKRLSQLYKNVYLWLDYDKREYAVKVAFERCMYLNITPIITELDPKCYTDGEIKQFLRREVLDVL